MSVDALNWALRQEAGGLAPKAVLLMLAHYTNAKSGLAWPSLAAMAEGAEMHRKSVIGCLGRLKRRGLIEDSGKRFGSTGKIIAYRLNLDGGKQPQTGADNRESSVTIEGESNGNSMRDHYPAPKQGSEGDHLTGSPELPLEGVKQGSLTASNRESSVTRIGKEDKEESPPTPSNPAARIFAAWNAMAKANGLPVAQSLTPARRKNLNARIKEHGPEVIERALKTIPDCGFLIGQGPNGWKAHFDWLLQPSSMTKLVEGAYAHGSASTEPKPLYQILTEERARANARTT